MKKGHSKIVRFLFLLMLPALLVWLPTPGIASFSGDCIVTITITVSANPVCSGTLVTFSSEITNGGSNPGYQWFVNGIGVGTGSTYSYVPGNGNLVTCQLTSNAPCSGSPAISNTITMGVEPILMPAVSIGVSSNPVCQGNQVTFTATPQNGGSSPLLQWFVNGSASGTTGQQFQYFPTPGDIILCQMASSATCISASSVNSNQITMSVIPLQNVGITITPSANPACAGSPVTFVASAANGGSLPQFQWTINGTPAGNNTSIYTCIPSQGMWSNAN